MTSEDTGPDEIQLAGLLDDFRAYRRPTTEEWKAAYTRGLIVLDTNAILDLYRFSPTAREDYLDILQQLRDRLYVPYRVAFEFHRRRVDAVRDHVANLEAILVEITKHARLLREATSRLARTRIAPERLQESISNPSNSSRSSAMRYLPNMTLTIRIWRAEMIHCWIRRLLALSRSMTWFANDRPCRSKGSK